MITFNCIIDGTDTVSNRHKCVYEPKDVPWHYLSRYRERSCGVLYESRGPIISLTRLGLTALRLVCRCCGMLSSAKFVSFVFLRRFGRETRPLEEIATCWCHLMSRQTASRWGMDGGMPTPGYPWSIFFCTLSIINFFMNRRIFSQSRNYDLFIILSLRLW